MKVKLKNKITQQRLATIGALIFVEAFLQPINAILVQGVWPQPVQVAACATTAVLQVVTMTLGLLERA